MLNRSRATSIIVDPLWCDHKFLIESASRSARSVKIQRITSDMPGTAGAGALYADQDVSSNPSPLTSPASLMSQSMMGDASRKLPTLPSVGTVPENPYELASPGSGPRV